MAAGPIKVLVVDDSAMIRNFLRTTLDQEPDIQVVDVAGDPFMARDKFLKHHPDVITLDIEMPKMNGLTFLQRLMAAHPTPVVMFSTHTQEGTQATLRALRLGAVDFLAKPTHNLSETLPALREELVEKVRAAAGARVRRYRAPVDELKVPQKVEIDQVVALTRHRPPSGGPLVVLLGASTGGTVALEQVLTRLPADSPPIAIVQHMPENFTLAFAQRLDQLCQIRVSEGQDGQSLPPGEAIIAPGGRHLLLEHNSLGYRVRVKDGPPVNRHKPSVDVLFRSGVNSAGANCLAILMTGMGDDGARGMKDLREAKAFTVAQSEESCTVYGMPKAAVALEAVERVVPLDRMPALIMSLWQDSRRAAGG
ncbi:MAG: chemotaxis response regulator protein-glutamate methylesterase [Deltaproteobacteria bacterium]|nr:chemotaxis response regulator protein-glutamate methylesterase [Deltaproteobacteria bacterium]